MKRNGTGEQLERKICAVICHSSGGLKRPPHS